MDGERLELARSLGWQWPSRPGTLSVAAIPVRESKQAPMAMPLNKATSTHQERHDQCLSSWEMEERRAAA